MEDLAVAPDAGAGEGGGTTMNETYGRSEWLLRAALREDRGGRPKVARALRQMAEDARPLEPSADPSVDEDVRRFFDE